MFKSVRDPTQVRMSIDLNPPNRDSRSRAYVEWSLIAVAYAFAFFQRVSPQTIVDLLAADFRIGAAQIGIVASAYFYAYTAMQFPAGLLVDRVGVRRIMIASLGVSVAGSLIFASAPNIALLCTGRVLVALGDAVVFSCLIKFVAMRFDRNRFGFMSGLSQISGYLGGDPGDHAACDCCRYGRLAICIRGTRSD